MNIKLVACLFTGLLCFAPDGPRPNHESRDYRVLVDGRPAGSYAMTFEKRDDGTQIQTGNADVRLRVFLKTFVYTFRGSETWKDDRLIRMASATYDDGTEYRVAADARNDQIALVVNGRSSAVPNDVWTMTYWRPPHPNRRDGPITLLDADTGKTFSARVRPAGSSVVQAAGQSIQASVYQVSGGATATLWYDAQDRLLRLDTISDGHRVTIELLRVSK